MFTADSRTENFLTAIGVKFVYTNDMTFGRLEPAWQQHNSGRSQVKVESAIEEYGLLMDRGSAAPAPILWQASDGTSEVLDGVQRLSAEKNRNSQTFSAYVVVTDSVAMVRKIRVFANYRLQGGHQESAEWTLSQAIAMLLNDGAISAEEVAEMGGWGVSVVREKKQLMDLGFRIRQIGGPEKLTDSILKIVSANSEQIDFDKAAKPLAEFFNAVKTMRLSADESEPYIEEVFSVARSRGSIHEQFSDKLAEFLNDDDIATRMADPSRRRYQPMTAEGRLMKALKGAETTAAKVLQEREKIPYVDEYLQILTRIKKTLLEIQNNSKRAKHESQKR
jgi:hypothetical protein